MEAGRGVDVIYTDFSKAFDTVDTGVLLHELKNCGVQGKVGCWLASFLDPSSRQQAVVVDISPFPRYIWCSTGDSFGACPVPDTYQEHIHGVV